MEEPINIEFNYLPGYGKRYKVYKNGRIFKNTGLEILPSLYHGYKRKDGKNSNIVPHFMICDDYEKTVYSLAKVVASLFVFNPNPNIYTVIRHKDGNKANCSADNLYWDKVKRPKKLKINNMEIIVKEKDIKKVPKIKIYI